MTQKLPVSLMNIDSEQYTSNLNPKPQQKDPTPQSSGIFARNARVDQHMQIKNCH